VNVQEMRNAIKTLAGLLLTVQGNGDPANS